MSTPVHKPAANPFASYAFQDNDIYEDEEEEETDWSDEDDLHSDSITDEFEVEFEDDFDDDDDDSEDDEEFDNNYNCDTEDSDREYVDDEDIHYRNNYAAGPGYFYPEQPYIGPPVVPKPSNGASTSKFSYYILSPICDIAMIYVKFAILAILIYACALWYTVYYGDLSSIADIDEDDADTCPAN